MESNNFAEARFTLCLRNYWCRGLLEDSSASLWNSVDSFKTTLRWNETYDNTWIDREEFPLLAYATASNCLDVVKQSLTEIMKTPDIKMRKIFLRARMPK